MGPATRRATPPASFHRAPERCTNCKLAPRRRQELTLQAQTETDVEQIYWFADKQFIGRAAPRDPVPWNPAPGTYCLTAVDDEGRADSENVEIECRLP